MPETMHRRTGILSNFFPGRGEPPRPFLFLAAILPFFAFSGCATGSTTAALYSGSLGETGAVPYDTVVTGTGQQDASAGTAVPVAAAAASVVPGETARIDPTIEDRVEERVEELLGRMSLSEKIGQRFIVWMPDDSIDPPVVQAIREGYPAGFILYRWNYDSPSAARTLIEALQATARENDPPLELLVCVDQEGGRVAAFRDSTLPNLSAPFYWGLHRDPEYARAAAYLLGRELRAIGCTMNLAPVLDLYGQPDSTIIGDRSMGADASLVASYAGSYVRGALAAGVIPVAKHFPGHGASTVDSHHRLPVVRKTERELLEYELVPYVQAFEAGCEAVMTAHVLYPLIDPEYPATLSPTILRGLLRGRLGFNGVIITDSLEMGALANNFSRADTLRQAFLAGVDLILLTYRYDFFEMAGLVRSMVEDGTIPIETINEGVRRVLRLKLRHGLAGQER
jgi:beta-N-acetylhexosaminidase